MLTWVQLGHMPLCDATNSSNIGERDVHDSLRQVCMEVFVIGQLAYGCRPRCRSIAACRGDLVSLSCQNGHRQGNDKNTQSCGGVVLVTTYGVFAMWRPPR